MNIYAYKGTNSKCLSMPSLKPKQKQLNREKGRYKERQTNK